MNYENITKEDVEFSHNAELLMDQRGLSRDSIASIVVDQERLVLPPDDSGVVVSEGIVPDNNKRVRVIISESDDSGGGSEDRPLVINTIVLGT